MSKTKRNSLLLLSVAGLLVLILAMSLPNLVFSSGQWFSFGELFDSENDSEIGGVLPGANGFERIIRGIMALALVLLPVHLVYSLLTSEGRRRLIRDVILVAALLLLASYLDKHPLSFVEQEQDPAAVSSANAEEGIALPAVEFPAEPPTWLTLAVILTISAFVVAVIFAIIGFFRRRAQTPDLVLEELAETARNTIETIQTGGNFEDAVIRCYQNMSRVVRENRGVAREMAMTPREFEVRLVSNGLPQEATETLTRLFEQVRYGSMKPDDRQENLALSCLTDIVTACKTMGVRHDTE